MEAAVAAEESIVEMIGASYSGTSVVPSEVDGDPVKYEFDASFQRKIAALAVRDSSFVRSVGHLLNPDHFEDVAQASLVSMVLNHFERYNTVPSSVVLVAILRDSKDRGVLSSDLSKKIYDEVRVIYKEPLVDREFIQDKLAEFARHQAVTQAIFSSVDLIKKKKFEQIEDAIKKAVSIGVNAEGESYDYFGQIKNRTEERLDRLAGKMPPTGITTGTPKLDDLLYHRGWGRRELTTIMGGAKAGKTTALIGFAKAASLAGHNTLYVTLEVSARIISERLDACLSETLMKELDSNVKAVEAKIELLEKKSARLNIHEFPSGTLTPNGLRDLLDKARAKGIRYDLVVVDYADIMAPNVRTRESIENSKSVYIDLRAIAFEFDCAMLTATQTNREGYKSTVAKAEHVSEDFNKVRTVDLMISINITEEERRMGQARLYFAASRNQESGFTVIVKQNIGMMRFIEGVVGVE